MTPIRSPSPTPSARSFLESDPYPSGQHHPPHHAPAPLLAHLETLLRAKAEEIQAAGTLGASLLAQQAELESRISEIALAAGAAASGPRGNGDASGSGGSGRGGDDSDNERDIGEETRRKLAALEEDLRKWDEGNSALYASVSSPAMAATSSAGASAHMSPSSSIEDTSASTGIDRSLEAQARNQMNRRLRNNVEHREQSVGLATEIGQQLLVEVKRLQALLAEKEELLKDAEAEKSAADMAVENAEAARKSVEETVEKYKEENWNLELASQELRANLVDAQAATSKADLERSRFAKDLATARDAAEAQRIATDNLTAQLESLKAKHETDVATLRKNTAGLQRDKSDLQSTLEGLKTQLAVKSRGITRVVSDCTGDDAEVDEELREEEDDDDDVFRGGRRKTGDGFAVPGSPGDMFSELGDSEHGSPMVPVHRGGPSEVETLRATLAHAQRTIAILKSKKNRGNDVFSGDSDSVSSKENTPLRTPVRSARGSARGGRRGRGAGPSRLGRSTAPQQEEGDDTEEEEVDSFGGDGDDAGSLFEHHFPSPGHQEDDLLSEAGTDYDSPSRLNYGDHSDDESVRSHGSVAQPQSLAGIGGFESNGRPASLISIDRKTRPTSGMFGSSPGSFRGANRGVQEEDEKEEEVRQPAVVWADASTMTDFPEPPVVTPEPVIVTVTVPAPKPDTADIGVQASLVLEATTVDSDCQTETITTQEFGTATDPIAGPVTAEVGTATDPIAAPPAGVEMEVQTDAAPEPNLAASTATMLPPAVLASAAAGSAASHLRPTTMEDRALTHQTSLSQLTPDSLLFTQANQSGVEDVTFVGKQRPSSDWDAQSSTTDRALDTETDGEFEDARESIGATSPVPTLTATPTASIHDFHSVRSSRTHHSFRTVDDSDRDDEPSDVEVLSTPRSRGGKFKTRTPERATPALVPKEMAEMGVQTDEVVAPLPELAPSLQLRSADRDSINTFGRPEYGEIGSTASVLAAGGLLTAGAASVMHSRPFSPEEDTARPDSIVSAFSQQTGDASPPPHATSFGTLPAPVGSAPASAPAVVPVSTPIAAAAQPPPSTTSMAPPSFIPARAPKQGSPRKSGASANSGASLRVNAPPARPTSPPPADLLYRAQSPTFDHEYERRSTLLVPGGGRQQLASRSSTLNSRSANLRPQASMNISDYNSTVGTAKGKAPARRGQHGAAASSGMSISDMSIHSDASRRQSMASSRTSDGEYDLPPRTGGDSTDPVVIHAITQTMIGEFLHKYTRRTLGKGTSEKRHKRFFWVHPYTKTLYWSSSDPGAQGIHQSTAKSVFIEGVRQVLDPNPNPPGLHQGSIIVKTPNREMKITAPTRERHDMWFNAIKYLLARPDPTPSTPGGPPLGANSAVNTPARYASQRNRSEVDFDTPIARNGAGLYNLGSASDSRLTPKGGRRGGNLSSVSSPKRPGTIADEFQRRTMFGSPRSVRTFSDNLGDESLEFVDRNDIPDDYEFGDEGFEGLENVRVCCGKHDVGSLSRRQHNHHHHHQSSHDEHQPLAPASPRRRRSKSSLGTMSSAFQRKVIPPSPSNKTMEPTSSSIHLPKDFAPPR